MIIILFVWIIPGQILLAQSNSYNGMSLHSSSSNRNSFTQGEPISFLFILKNNTEQEINYWKKLTGVNIYFTLFDSKEQIIGSSENSWRSYEHVRHNVKEKQPEKEYSFHPWEEFLIEFELGLLGFGSFPDDVKGKVPTVHGGEDLNILENGNYRLKVEYYLFPVNKKIEIDHHFEVTPLPNEEQVAYEAFKEATIYTSKNHFVFDNSYNPQHPNSYENFIKNYPSSIFVQYAYSNLIEEIYNYPNNISSTIKDPIFNDYFISDKVDLPNLKVQKAKSAIKALSSKSINIDANEVIDKQLKSLRNDDPAISDNLIVAAKEKLKLNDLKNYACEKK